MNARCHQILYICVLSSVFVYMCVVNFYFIYKNFFRHLWWFGRMIIINNCWHKMMKLFFLIMIQVFSHRSKFSFELNPSKVNLFYYKLLRTLCTNWTKFNCYKFFYRETLLYQPLDILSVQSSFFFPPWNIFKLTQRNYKYLIFKSILILYSFN